MPYVGAIFFVVIIYAGVQYITAGGDKKQIDAAKSMLQRAFIGLLIIFFAFAVVSTVVNLLARVATGSGGQTVQ
jgi:TRAP-type C4-dicarboxylate transport system permease small subunit